MKEILENASKSQNLKDLLFNVYHDELTEMFGDLKTFRFSLNLFKSPDASIHEIMQELRNIKKAYDEGETINLSDIKPNGEIPDHIRAEINKYGTYL